MDTNSLGIPGEEDAAAAEARPGGWMASGAAAAAAVTSGPSGDEAAPGIIGYSGTCAKIG